MHGGKAASLCFVTLSAPTEGVGWSSNIRDGISLFRSTTKGNHFQTRKIGMMLPLITTAI